MKALLAKALPWVGRVVSLGTLVWVVVLAWRQRALFRQLDSAALILAFAGITLVYAAAIGLLALGWIRYLPQPARVTLRGPLFRMYARTSLAKYLPGNVFHFVGRQAAASWPGLGHVPLARASIFENFSLLCAASLAGSLVWLGDAGDAGAVPVYVPILGGCGAAAVPAVLYGLARKLKPDLLGGDWTWRTLYPRLFPSYLLHLLFFVASGSLFVQLTNLLAADGVMVAWPDVFPVYALSWLVGFVTPGTPGGLGVREAMLTAFLAPLIGDAHAVQAALTFRLVTVLGDLVFALGASLFLKPVR